MSSTTLTSEEQPTEDADENQNTTPEDPICINIEALDETYQIITITSDIFQQNEETEYIPAEFLQEIICEPLIEDLEESCEDPINIITDECDNQNESLETEEKAHSCLICGSSNTTNTEFLREKWIENEHWRKECAETICDMFFSSQFHPFNEFFQIAYYCTSCQKLIWEADCTRRMILSMQKTIDKLSISLRKRFALNCIKLNTSQRHKDNYPPSSQVFEFPSLSFDEVVQQIYSENSSAFDLDNMNETKYMPLQTTPKSHITDTYTKARISKPREKHYKFNLDGSKRKPGRPKKRKRYINNQTEENYADNSVLEIKRENELLSGTEEGVENCNSARNITKPGRLKKKIINTETNENALLYNGSSEINTNHDSQGGYAGNSIADPVTKIEYQLPITDVVMDYCNLPEIKGKRARPRKQIFNIKGKHHERLNNCSTENCDNFEVKGQQTSPEPQLKLELDGDILNSRGKIVRKRKPPQRFATEDMSSKGLLSNQTKKVENSKRTAEIYRACLERRRLRQQTARELHNMRRRLKRKRLRDLREKSCPVEKMSKHLRKKYYPVGNMSKDICEKPCSVEGCDFMYVKKSTLRRHVKIEHQGIQVDEILSHCPVDGCGKKYTTNTVLKHHVKTLHEGIKKIYNCKFCPKKFHTLTGLRRHKFIHPENKIAPDDPKYFKPIYDFTCAICDQGYLKEEDLAFHMEIHSGPNPFVCSYCNKEFTNREELANHIRREHDLETPTCEFCGKCFTNGRSLQKHRKIHLDPDECFKCLECDFYTVTKKSLSFHVSLHHREATNAQCETCGKTFKGPLYLRQHMRCHNNEKRFKCHICERSFKTWNSRKTHEEIHSGLRMFVCTLCGKGMTTLCGLKYHERIHTRDPNVPLPKRPYNERKKKYKTPFNLPHIVDCINNVAIGNATQNNESS